MKNVRLHNKTTRSRPDRGQNLEVEAEAKASRPRPRPKFWLRGHFGLEDLTSLFTAWRGECKRGIFFRSSRLQVRAFWSKSYYWQPIGRCIWGIGWYQNEWLWPKLRVIHFYVINHFWIMSKLRNWSSNDFCHLADTNSTVWVKKIPPLRFSEFFPKWLGIFNHFFTHLLYEHFYTRVQIFI